MTSTQTYRLKVKEMPTAEQPAYRAQQVGVTAMSSSELLQLITRSHYMDGVVKLRADAGTLHDLAKMPTEEIAGYDSIGEGMALSIKAAFELGRRLTLERPEEKSRISSPADAAAMLMPMIGGKEQEHFVVLVLDTKNHVVHTEIVYKGSVNTCVIRTGEVFRSAVRKNGVAIIVAHNHPTGDPTPSPEDVAVTRKIVQAGQVMDVEVLDHLIIGRGRFVSLKERNLGF